MGCEPSVREPGIFAGCQEGSGGDEAEDGEECEVEAKGWREGMIAFVLLELHAILEFGGNRRWQDTQG